MFKSKYVKSLSAAIILASGLLVSTPTTEASRNFVDINSDPAHSQAVNYFNNLGVYDYKQDGYFNGGQGVTRIEVSKILHNVLEDTLEMKRIYNDQFSDVMYGTSSYDASIVWAYEVGIFDGNNEGRFNPYNTLTRAQMAKILVNALGLKSKGTYTFNDVDEDHWAYEYVSILASNGITTGSNGNFMPGKEVTLNQLSTFLYRAQFGGESATITSSTYLEESTVIDSYEEVKRIAADLFNSPEYSPEPVTIYTKYDFEPMFEDDMDDHNLSYLLNAENYYGRYVDISTRVLKDKPYYKTVIRIYNDRTEEEEMAYRKKMQNAASYIKSKYKTTTDYDKVKAVAEFLSTQLTYNKPISSNHPFLDPANSTVCRGYADAANNLLYLLGVDSHLVLGYNNEHHIWNAVKVDGRWYHFDATFYDSDNGANLTKYLLMTESQFKSYGYTSYTEFTATNVAYK